ncbi:MAG: ABC transporter permease subunit [Candidatus Latescibacteria bacterium]|nr:ABC transporter permease subunit [bacterium]MBD3424460.1 ABC transporter permease subunit [Candidatus Latescibacterota bacterium]
MSTGKPGRIWNVTVGDLRITVKEKSLIIWLFLMPLAFMFFFGSVYGGGGRGTPRTRITVENNDLGFLGDDLEISLSDENLFLVDSDSLAETQNPVRTLIIPEDFTTRVLSRDKVEVVLRKEKGSHFEAGIAAEAAIVRALARLGAGIIELETEEVSKGKPGFTVQGDSVSGSLMELSGGDQGMIYQYQGRLDSLLNREAVVGLKPEMAGRKKYIPTGFQSSVPGSLVMFVLMSMVFSGAALVQERVSGQLKRIAVSPVSKGEIILGKLFARMVVAAFQILFLLLAGRVLFGIKLGSSYPALVVLMITFAFCTGSFSLLFGSLFRDPEKLDGIAILTTLVMASLGGCWWPLEVLSRPFRIVAFMLPTGWAMNGIHKLISFGYGFGAITNHLLALLLFGSVFILIASRRLRVTV